MRGLVGKYRQIQKVPKNYGKEKGQNRSMGAKMGRVRRLWCRECQKIS